MLRIVTLSVLIFASQCIHYDPERANGLYRIAMAAYCKPVKIIQWDCEPCESTYTLTAVQAFFNDEAHIYGYIGSSDDLQATVIFMKGSNEEYKEKMLQQFLSEQTQEYHLCDGSQKIDKIEQDMDPSILAEINFEDDSQDNNLKRDQQSPEEKEFSVPVFQKVQNCKVHKNSYSNYKIVQKDMLKMVDLFHSNPQSYKQYIVVGFSIAGVYASLITADLLYRGYSVQEMYTFGSPRPGNKEFTQWFNGIFPKDGLSARVTHRQDPTLHYPSQESGFLHTPHQVFYHSDRHFHHCNDHHTAKEDPNCSSQYKDKLSEESFKDHLTYFGIDFEGIVDRCEK